MDEQRDRPSVAEIVMLGETASAEEFADRYAEASLPVAFAALTQMSWRALTGRHRGPLA